MAVVRRTFIYCIIGLVSLAADASFQNDLPELNDFDVAAQTLWSEILDCSGGDTPNARNAYFAGKFSCYNGAEIKSKITELHVQLRNYLQTAEVGPFAAKVSQHKGEHVHPLLSQILLEVESTVFKFSTTYGFLVNGLDARWIDPMYSPDFYDRIQDLSRLRNTNTPEYDLARLFVNSVGISKVLIAKHKCSSIGLSAATSSLITKAISLQQSTVKAQFAHTLLLDTISCEGDDEGNLDYKKTIKEFRLLAKKYGVETYRETKCVHDFLNFINPFSRDNGIVTYCISLDPANPQDKVPVRQ